MQADISIDIAGLRLNNPTMLASGILGETGETLRNVAKAGAGALVTKSLGREPRPGYENPTVVELEGGLINAMGLPNPGIDAFKDELAIAAHGDAPVIGSIFGSSPKEIADLAEKVVAFGASAVEINLSCPHAKGYGMEVGLDKELTVEIIGAVKDRVRAPVFPKLSPLINDIPSYSKAVEEAGADGLVLINTLKAMAIDVDLRCPVLHNKMGGLSGPAIRPVGVRCVYEAFKSVDIPIIGVGGVVTGRDALEYIMAGASAVQIGTGVYNRGIGVFSKVASEIRSYMVENEVAKLSGLVGCAQEV